MFQCNMWTEHVLIQNEKDSFVNQKLMKKDENEQLSLGFIEADCVITMINHE